jgi:hypothetical protein
MTFQEAGRNEAAWSRRAPGDEGTRLFGLRRAASPPCREPPAAVLGRL